MKDDPEMDTIHFIINLSDSLSHFKYSFFLPYPTQLISHGYNCGASDHSTCPNHPVL